ncbi:MAG: acetate--CoA ligase [Anaerolineales bacterium]
MTLTPFLNPKGIVVIGASTSPEKLGYGVARNIIQSGYAGAIHFVSQKSGTLFDRPIFSSVAEIPDPVDLAILIVPTQATPQAIEACGRRGIKAAIIVSAGFREVGAEGAALEKQCVEIARAQGVRLLGPNCIGALDTHLPLDVTFLQPPMPAQGNIGFISHSGAFCAAIIDWAREQGFGFSQIVSLGNQADVNETDMLPEVAKDKSTNVIVMYMESVSNGRQFVKVASEVTKHKPVIALKVGRFEAGQKAAASHTGALAGAEAAFDAAFEKCGVLRADSAEQMFDWARALAACPPPNGCNMAILTNAGGPGVIAADALETNGLKLSVLSKKTEEKLAALLPSSASVHNPVDMLASASPQQYAQSLKILLADENVNGVMVILPPPPMFKTEQVADALIPLIGESSKPVVVALMGSTLIKKAEQRFKSANVPTYPFPERAASALGVLARRQKFLEEGRKTEDGRQRTEDGRQRTEDGRQKGGRRGTEELLAAYEIPAVPMKLARDEKEAAQIANGLGFPIVMKIASPDILHKSDLGGVLLDVASAEEVRSGYAALVERAKKAMPQAKIDGVHLQHQVPQGQEVIVGMTRDPLFGALMMFGSGGVEVEGLRDVAFALAPLNLFEARETLRKTWAGRKLRGFRNIPPADEDSALDVLVKLSRLADEHEEIEEIEINPLRVLRKGAAAVDVRVKWRA